ncbi:glucose-1-phosphate adenylyltransferase [Aliicoccus persicus]|uniref:Glucose-1-phosphate adenylyltransferase n=1 Tax=Aliicoccus persicus TaxID=930138 RepID=A0A662Z248_9STAP|nr:glucose-1-phosphate adenylyltransferase [Aliicoccus persicus]SEV80995.1 glucose-1-phosphate adenylyltransferase [Aliicoccus persicus]
MSQKTVAMLLAGGKGTRLGELTKDIAKPAVPFGGKYRIIDFTMSNLANSRISTVGVLVQYSPLMLNKHLGIGAPWGLDRQAGGLSTLSPYSDRTRSSWFSGTADAIVKNIHYIEQFEPKYLLVLSGDHVYQMNYRQMIDFHEENEADATISVIEVPFEDAHRFGILNTNEDGSIYEFEEKPENPKSNNASMGIYVFTWDVVKPYLIADEQDETSDHDFGKDIIPALLKDKRRLYAYTFEGYWKDVGTIQSYWESNMDLLDDNNQELVTSRSWEIYPNEKNLPPEYIGEDTEISNSMISPGSFIEGRIKDSILFNAVETEKDVSIQSSIIHPDVIVRSGAVLDRVIVMEGVEVPAGAVIKTPEGQEPIVISQSNIRALIQSGGHENE